MATCQSYIDPGSICCVVLDEAHHCGKEHPFHRVSRSFLTAGIGTASSLPTKPPSEYPKVTWSTKRVLIVLLAYQVIYSD